jgi:N-acetylated-alpha-linked acidic dipeptidase
MPQIRRSTSILFALAAILTLSAAAPDSSEKLIGFSDEAGKTELGWEAKFKAIPSPDNLREYNRRLSARPHHVGSPYDKDNAEWILSKFKEWGWDAHIESFKVLFPTPKERLVEMIAPTHFTAKLEEPTVAEDPTSNQHDEQLPVYNAYSIDGDVTAPLVYVNHGVPDDYDQLERLGVSVKGAIVIARYGGSWRGIKPKVAAEHGAVGCLIYSDPHEDGYFQGDVFPKGPWRPPDGAQRGSVMDIPVYSGDPLTPGVGATEDAKRLALDQVKVFTKIPTLPVSYADAQPLLNALTGAMAPAAWRGALDLSYHVGAGATKVHLVMKSNWDLKPLYDVIARIPGSTEPDEWIIRGNHHDAWVNGAEDPISGQMCLLEEARAFGDLLKQGWRPRRTIIYAAWDGEEPGLLGSTEWAETHEDELQRHAAVYINSDSNGRGYLGMGGSHSLQKFVNQVASDVEDPEAKVSAWKRDQLRRIENAASDKEREEIRQRKDLRLNALGSGSDYTPFLQHLGISSLSLEYGGETQGGIYHSIYDDFYWYSHFGDPSFVYGRALSQTIGTAVMRLADTGLLPYQFSDFAETVRGYVDELQKVLSSERDQIRERNKEIDEGLFSATADPDKTSVPPRHETDAPHLNFAPLENAVDALASSADRFQKALNRAETNGGASLDSSAMGKVNEVLMQSERKLITPDGLPRRSWYRHQIYAPGYYTGYDVKTIPGVREAIEQKQWAEADQEIPIVAKVLRDEAALVDSASAALEAALSSKQENRGAR